MVYIMNIIVTGGAGFIGGNFCHYMTEKYPEDMILCIDKLTYAGNMETLAPIMDKPNFKFFKADIADRDTIYKIFEKEKPDIVVNFAAESHVDRSINEPEVFLRTNIIGTNVMLHAVNMESSVTTRFLLMKYMVTFHLTGQTFSLQKQHQSIQAVLILLQKHLQTFLYRHTHVLITFHVRFQGVQIITGLTIFQKNLSLL